VGGSLQGLPTVGGLETGATRRREKGISRQEEGVFNTVLSWGVSILDGGV